MVRFKGVFLSLLLLLFSSTTVFALPALYDWGFNVDGVVSLYDDPLPAEVDFSAFDWDTGLGILSLEFTAVMDMDYAIIAFFDHEIDEAINTYFNEFGTAIGTPDADQSWEIDEPGWVFGDIYDNLLDGMLDNSNAVPEWSQDDVSMALGWDLSLLEGDTLFIEFILDTEAPSDFYLMHMDSESEEAFYFSSTATITPAGTEPVPEPTTILLLGAGLVGLIAGRKYFT